VLLRNGNVIEHMELSGVDTTETFETALYAPGVEAEYTVVVYDTTGNRVSKSKMITADGSANQAPAPFAIVSPPQANPGDLINLDASRARDPEDGVAGLIYEWQFEANTPFITGGRVRQHQLSKPR
jgi:hypothetical protein